MKTLDRYLLREWIKIMLLAEIGFPLVVIIIDLTDKLGSYLARGLGRKAVALSYLYYLPDVMFLVLPAAVLFASDDSISKPVGVQLSAFTQVTDGMKYPKFHSGIFVKVSNNKSQVHDPQLFKAREGSANWKSLQLSPTSILGSGWN